MRLPATCLLIGFLLALSAPALPEPPKHSATHTLAAQRLLQLARRLAPPDSAPSPEALELARTLLAQAADLAPEDPEICRARLDLYADPAPADPLSALVRCAPEDEVAQLRLVDQVISRSQTATQRVSTCRRIAASAQLSKPLRSRVAWRGALIERERGDEAAFRKLLKQSLELDPANPHAAAAAYRMIQAQSPSDPIAATRALLLWHAANPADPQVHLLIARRLLACGDYAIACAWFDSADLLATNRPPAPPAQAAAMVRDWALSLWGAGFPDQALQLIGSVEKSAGSIPAELREISTVIQAQNGRAAQPPQPSPDQIKSLSDLHARQRHTLAGIVAYDQLRRLGAMPPLDETCRTVGAMVRQVPEELRRIAESPGSFLSLRLTPIDGLIRYAQPVRFTIQLTNISQIPLSLGPDGVVPPIVALIPQATTGIQSHTLSPQIINLHRAITLAPGQSVIARSILSGPDLTALLDQHADRNLEISITAVLSPALTTTQDGHGASITPGLMGLATRSRPIERPGTPPDDVEIASAVIRARNNPPEGMPWVAWLAWAVGRLPPERENQALDAAAALTDAFDRYDAPGRVWLVSYLVPGEAVRRRIPHLLERALLQEPPIVQYAALLALADRPDAPELTAVLRLPESNPAHAFALKYRAVLSSHKVSP